MGGGEALPVRAIVLRRWDFAETSQTARLYTREMGRIGVLAKGIKRGGADLRGPMDLFEVGEGAVRRRRSSDLHLLVRWRVVTGFPGLRRNLERFHAASFVTEILREGTRDDDPAPELFDVTVAALGALESASSAGAAGIAAWYALRWLDLAGFAPRFDACVGCGRRAPPVGPVRYALARGGLWCRRCAAERPLTLVALGPRARRFLHGLRAAPLPVALPTADPGAPEGELSSRFIPTIVEVAMDRELHSRPFLAS